MAAYTSNPITDPDQLGYDIDVAFASATEEIVITTSTKKIALKVTGNLGTDGATIKAVYSKLKDAWRASSTLVKLPFAMGPITDEQYEFINGWTLDSANTSGAASQKTSDLLRTGGWSVLNTSGAITELWTSVITLGSLGSTDQVYYQQTSGASSVDFVLTGPVNQAIQVLNDPNGDGSYVDGFDRRSYLKLFVREWQKLYAQSEIADIGVSQMTYQAYRFPLTNSTDLKVTHTQVQIDENSNGTPDVGVYANVNITYLRHTTDALYNIRGSFASDTAYALADVVQDTGTMRWFKCILAYTSSATQPSANSTNWASYEGERQIGSYYYAFSVIIDADTTVGASVSGSARSTEIYEAVQYYLRQATDIDSDATASVIGKTANSLLRFVGDTLVTSNGVYIDSFNTQDTNAIEFYDYSGAKRTFPYVAALTVNFGDNLQNDQYAKYWVFFDNAGGNQFGTTNAIVVQDKDSDDMSGVVNPAWPTKRTFVSHSFNYDSNTQGGRTAGTDANIVAVGIGLVTGQYVKTTGVIQKSTANAVALVSALERNYAQGTTYP